MPSRLSVWTRHVLQERSSFEHRQQGSCHHTRLGALALALAGGERQGLNNLPWNQPGQKPGLFFQLPARLCLALSVSFWNRLRPPVLYWPELRFDELRGLLPIFCGHGYGCAKTRHVRMARLARPFGSRPPNTRGREGAIRRPALSYWRVGSASPLSFSPTRAGPAPTETE
jgi:hypothetical protein